MVLPTAITRMCQITTLYPSIDDDDDDVDESIKLVFYGKNSPECAKFDIAVSHYSVYGTAFFP